MAITPVAGGRKSGRGRRGVPRYGAMADINMTPFIDVMLVLLIIFMVAAPLLTTGVAVDLPRASAAALNVEHKPIAVSLNEQGQLFVMDQPIDRRGSGLEASGGVGKRYRPAHLSSRLEDGALRARRRDHGGGHLRRVQEGGPRHRADQTIAGSGVGRTAVIFEFRGLRGAARGAAGDDPARVRLGPAIRGSSGSDSDRDSFAERTQPDRQWREGRQARAAARACAA